MSNPAYSKRTFIVFAALLVVVGIQSVLQARFRRPDLENVPVKDLIENLKKKVEAEPKNAELRINLGRVYAMAYSQKLDTIRINKRNPDKAWFGYTPPHVPFSYIKNTDDKEKIKKAKASLKLAIAEFKKAVDLDKNNLTAQLSLAWCTDQSGKDKEAIKMYRAIVEKAWETEKAMTRGGLRWRSVVVEAGGYLKSKLDKEKDRKEIESIDEKIGVVNKIPRPITPIAIGLKPGMTVSDIENRNAVVKFDADGTDLGKNWSWISRDAAWLVYDKKNNGQITSGLQLFGNVTFWCFWTNGYAALSSLDRNGDQKLSGRELEHLALWRDINQNGVSDPGEVKKLSHYEIVEINCRFTVDQKHRDKIAFSATGVKFKNGETRATYDIVLQQR